MIACGSQLTATSIEGADPSRGGGGRGRNWVSIITPHVLL